MGGEKAKKKFKVNAFCLLFCVIVICALASYFVTPGTFEREVVNGRTVVVPGSYHQIDKTFLSPMAIFNAIPNGIIGAANMVVLVLVIGGAIEIYSKCGSIRAGISKLVSSVGQKGGPLVITVFYLVFAILGGFLGWIETCIPFAPLLIPILLALGYDTIVGVAILVLGLMVGFAIGPTNIYTVGIAHEVSQLPMFSGIELRMVAYVIFVSVTLFYLLWYAARVRKNPKNSYMDGIDVSDLYLDLSEKTKMTTQQAVALCVLGLTFVVSIYGMFKLSWSIVDMAGAFLLSGIISGFITKMKASEIADTFIEGAKGAMGGAMIIGVARGVQWILEQGGIIDPIINGLSHILQGLPPIGSAIGVLIVVTLLNALVPSGSGKAMALMPILMPLAELIGLTRQTTILAYQFGDGISNIFWFTYGGLLIFLSYGKVPLSKWYKFLWPLLIMLFVLAIIFLVIAVQIGYGPA